MKLFPLVNHCNRPPPTKEFCNYLVKSVFFFTGFAPESHWVCKSGGLYISYQYLLTGSQSHLVLFGEKQVLFYFLSIWQTVEPGRDNTTWHENGKGLPAPRGKFQRKLWWRDILILTLQVLL